MFTSFNRFVHSPSHQAKFPSDGALVYNDYQETIGERSFRSSVMLHRLALPLIFFLFPRLGPPIFRFVRLIWHLSFDKRVPFSLRTLVPLAILYFLLPIDLIPDRLGYLGKFDDIIILAMAVLLLTKFAPRHVVDEHSGSSKSDDRPKDDPDKIVEGSGHIVDDE